MESVPIPLDLRLKRDALEREVATWGPARELPIVSHEEATPMLSEDARPWQPQLTSGCIRIIACFFFLVVICAGIQYWHKVGYETEDAPATPTPPKPTSEPTEAPTTPKPTSEPTEAPTPPKPTPAPSPKEDAPTTTPKPASEPEEATEAAIHLKGHYYSNTKYLADFSASSGVDFEACKDLCTRWKKVCKKRCEDKEACALNDELNGKFHSLDVSCSSTCVGFNMHFENRCTLFGDDVELRCSQHDSNNYYKLRGDDPVVNPISCGRYSFE